jgi:hypothetical protein
MLSAPIRTTRLFSAAFLEFAIKHCERFGVMLAIGEIHGDLEFRDANVTRKGDRSDFLTQGFGESG